MPHPAEIVLVGDSTCGVGVDAVDLSRQLPGQPQAINLALVLGVDLGTYAETAADFASANPGQVRWVVLLLCPLKLTRGMEPSGEVEVWRRIRNEMRAKAPRRGLWSEQDYFGTRFLRREIGAWILPETLRGSGAAVFGFTSGMERYLADHNGSGLDFGEYTIRHGQTWGEWFIAPEFENDCREFRRKMPRGVKLAVGLTPVPAVGRSDLASRTYQERLREWNAWIQADLVLSNLPATLPAPMFSPTAHLNASGQKVFTAALARELSGVIPLAP